jgi:hypothetical protein
MKIAVIQHRIRPTFAEDAEALSAAVTKACDAHARVVVCPWVPSLAAAEAQERAEMLESFTRCAEGTTLLLAFRAAESSDGARIRPTPLGPTALMLGDECLSRAAYAAAEAAGARAWVWRPRSTSDLQSEAVLEQAIAASATYVGLILLAECSGAEPGEIGHGASAVLYLGDVIAEASEPDDVLIVDVDAPVGPPEPREPMPPLPPILEQRLAVHEGRKPDVGYLADLS